MAKVKALWHWKVLALGLVSSILLVVVCIIMSTPIIGFLLSKSSLQGQDNNFYYSKKVDYHSTKHRSYSRRRFLDNEYPRSRSTPSSYPPPKHNVQTSPFRRPQAPPHP